MVRKIFSIALLLVIVAGAFSLIEAPEAVAQKPGDIVEPEPIDDGACPRLILGNGFYCLRVTYCTYQCYTL